MTGPISDRALQSAGGLPSVGHAKKAAGSAADDFAGLLREQLERVNQMQGEADANLQKLLSGQTENLTEVFTTTRKAGLAFSLLMEIRNKLVDAYEELKNMRV